jgi:hypothetical protein
VVMLLLGRMLACWGGGWMADINLDTRVTGAINSLV